MATYVSDHKYPRNIRLLSGLWQKFLRMSKLTKKISFGKKGKEKKTPFFLV